MHRNLLLLPSVCRDITCHATPQSLLASKTGLQMGAAELADEQDVAGHPTVLT